MCRTAFETEMEINNKKSFNYKEGALEATVVPAGCATRVCSIFCVKLDEDVLTRLSIKSLSLVRHISKETGRYLPVKGLQVGY